MNRYYKKEYLLENFNPIDDNYLNMMGAMYAHESYLNELSGLGLEPVNENFLTSMVEGFVNIITGILKKLGEWFKALFDAIGKIFSSSGKKSSGGGGSSSSGSSGSGVSKSEISRDVDNLQKALSPEEIEVKTVFTMTDLLEKKFMDHKIDLSEKDAKMMLARVHDMEDGLEKRKQNAKTGKAAFNTYENLHKMQSKLGKLRGKIQYYIDELNDSKKTMEFPGFNEKKLFSVMEKAQRIVAIRPNNYEEQIDTILPLLKDLEDGKVVDIRVALEDINDVDIEDINNELYQALAGCTKDQFNDYENNNVLNIFRDAATDMNVQEIKEKYYDFSKDSTNKLIGMRDAATKGINDNIKDVKSKLSSINVSVRNKKTTAKLTNDENKYLMDYHSDGNNSKNSVVHNIFKKVASRLGKVFIDASKLQSMFITNVASICLKEIRARESFFNKIKTMQ